MWPTNVTDEEELERCESRQWHWVFRALWSVAHRVSPVAPERQDEDSFASNVANLSRGGGGHQLKLRLPDTILFERGEPRKWVGCSPEGIIVRKSFSPATTGAAATDTTHEISKVVAEAATSSEIRRRPVHRGSTRIRSISTMDETEVLKRLKVIRETFLSLAKSSTPLPSITPLCVARYNDGSTEILSDESLQTLGAFHNWRISLAGLQSYVSPSAIGTGIYDAEINHKHRDPSTGLQQLRGRSCEGTNASQTVVRSGTSALSTERGRSRGRELDDGSTSLSPPEKVRRFRQDLVETHPVVKAQNTAGATTTAAVQLAAALDQATMDIAFFAENSYGWPGTQQIRFSATTAKGRDTDLSGFGWRSSIDRARMSGPVQSDRPIVIVGGREAPNRTIPWPKSRLRVRRLEAEFIIDEDGCAWFSTPTRILVQSRRRQPREQIDAEASRCENTRLQEEAATAATMAAQELRAVLTLARKRGLNAEDIFRHFCDDMGVGGRAEKRMVLTGMAKLGIALSEEASALLVKMIIVNTEDSRPTKPSQLGPKQGRHSVTARRPTYEIGEGTPRARPEVVRTEDSPASTTARVSSSSSLSLQMRDYFTANDLWAFARPPMTHNEGPAVTSHTGGESTHNRGHPLQAHKHTVNKPCKSSAASKALAGEVVEFVASPKRKRIAANTIAGDISRSGVEETTPAIGKPQKATRRTKRRYEHVSPVSKGDPIRSSHDDDSRRPATPVSEMRPGSGTQTVLPTSKVKNNKLQEFSLSNARHRRGNSPINCTGTRQPVDGDSKDRVVSNKSPGSYADRPAVIRGEVAHDKLGVAHFPCEDPVAEAIGGKDRVFHVDRGLVVAYRVLRNNTHQAENPPSVTADSSGVVSGADESTPVKRDGSPINENSSPGAIIVAIPGLFQTLDTLEDTVVPLFGAHAHLTILLVAPPGLPNTHWPLAAKLDGELTAFCVSALLEHLLQGDELGHATANSPTTAAGQHPFGDASSNLGYEVTESKAAGGDSSPTRHEQTRPPLSGASADAGSSPRDFRELAVTTPHSFDTASTSSTSHGIPVPASSPSPSSTPVIFVGFGTSAHALLCLASKNLCSAPTESTSDHKNEEDVDGIPVAIAKDKRGANVHRGRSGDSSIMSALRSNALHLGGMILINGFMSLDQRSLKVIDILRQAFSDQQDGHARAEAVSSLLLSEQHLQQETTSSTSTLSTGTGTAWRAPTRASVVEEFLRARQAFKIDANGSAAAHHCVATGLVPPSVGGAMATASVGRSLSAASEEGTEPEAGVSVTSVLREMGQKRRSRLRQVLRRRYGQQKHHRYRQRSRRKHITRAEMSNCSAGTAVESGLFDRLSEDRYNEKHEGEGEGKRRATRKSNGVDGMSSRSRPWHPMWEHVKNGTQPSTKGTEEETGGGQDEEASFVTRLALAASVSMIDGLLSNNMDVEREGVSFCPESVSHRCGVSDGSGGNSSTGGVGRDDDLREAVRGCERMGLPLLLVQSTEDALIGTPLPLLLEQELSPDELARARAATIYECLQPPSLTSMRGNRRVASSTSPCGGVGATAGDSRDSPEDDNGEQGQSSLRIHTCWVKAGHDMLHERKPFLLALLDKAIYACHGCEHPAPTRVAVPAPFLSSRSYPLQSDDIPMASAASGDCVYNDVGLAVKDRQQASLVSARTFETPGGLDGGAGDGVRTDGVGGERTKSTQGEESTRGDEIVAQRVNGGAEPLTLENASSPSTSGVTFKRGAADACDGEDGGTRKDGNGRRIQALEAVHALDGSRLCPPSRGTGDAAAANLKDENKCSKDYTLHQNHEVGGRNESSCIGNTGDESGRSVGNEAKMSFHVPVETSTASTDETTASTATTEVGIVPKLLDFFCPGDKDSDREFLATRHRLESFGEFSSDVAAPGSGAGGMADEVESLNASALARFAFQTMKDCWRCKMLAVEASRLDTDVRKRQAHAREQLALSIRSVSNMKRTLRGSSKPPPGEESVGDAGTLTGLLALEPLDQRALRVEITEAERQRAANYYACRELRRRGAVLHARQERLAGRLTYLTEGVRGSIQALNRIMGQIRKHLAMARIQERVIHQEFLTTDQRGRRARRRLLVVEEQLEMLRRHPHKWTDSDAWVGGYMQRLETADLVKLLMDERRELTSISEKAKTHSAHTTELRSGILNRTAELVSKMEGVGAVFILLKNALEEDTFTESLETAATEQEANENESLGFGETDSGNTDAETGGHPHQRYQRRRRRRQVLQSTASRVRSTPHTKRTADEKRWVALDAVLNPQLYHHVTVAEAEEMRWDTLYYTRLDREDIVRVLSLPSQVQLALPFLHTPDEVSAHELLARFTSGFSLNHFARLDMNSQDLCITTPLTRITDAAAYGKEAPSVAEDDSGMAASARVLACMRRGAATQQMLAAERDEEEAVWIEFDRKLRPQYYHQNDEAAGDSNEEAFRDADEREDARNTWLHADANGDMKCTGVTSVVNDTEACEMDGIVPSCIAVNASVGCVRSAVEAGAAETPEVKSENQNQDTEAFARHIADAFDKGELIRMAMGQPRWSEHPATAMTSIGTTTAAHDLGEGGKRSENVAEQTTKAIAVENERAEDQNRSNLPNPDTDDSGMADKEITRGLSGRVGSTTWMPEGTCASRVSITHHAEQVFASSRRTEGKASAGREEEVEGSHCAAPASERRGLTTTNISDLEEIARHALSQCFVREEETPLGRNMTRSLAMLQEICLRLGRGEDNVLSGLNRHTAYTALLACDQTHVLPARGNDSAAAIASSTTDGERSRDQRRGRGEENTTAKPAREIFEELPARRKACATSICNDEVKEPLQLPEFDMVPVERFPSLMSSPLVLDQDSGSGRTSRPSSGDGGPSDSSEGAKNAQAELTPGGTIKTSKARTVPSAPSTKHHHRLMFGSWEELHPAALGVGAQQKEFSSVLERNGTNVLIQETAATGDHPASFRSSASIGSASIQESPPSVGTTSTLLTADSFSPRTLKYHQSFHNTDAGSNDLPLDPLGILTGEADGSSAGWMMCDARGGSSSSLVASGMGSVGECDPGEVRRRGLLVASRERECLLEVNTCELQAGQSKAYGFNVGPYTEKVAGGESSGHYYSRPRAQNTGLARDEAKVIVGIAVTVVFQGHFEKEGYRLGRLAAGLYRMPERPRPSPPSPSSSLALPEEQGPSDPRGEDVTGEANAELPKPVGFCPYALQSLNTPESLGRIMIFHQPRVQPVREGRFQVVIGAASRVRYSITVTAVTAADAHSAFEKSLAEAIQMQERLSSLEQELEALKNTSKLSRWKQLIVRELLVEAQEEAIRCDAEASEIKREIQEDENDQRLDEDGRHALLAEARELHLELKRWKEVFTSRRQEGRDVRAGVDSMKVKINVLQDESKRLQRSLAQARRTLPAAAFVLKSQRDATDIALRLNSTVDPCSGAAATWAAAGMLHDRAEAILTPAERVRRALREKGWDALTIEEQRFSMLDRVLYPERYEWMRQGRLDEQGNAVLASTHGSSSPEGRRVSLVDLIGAGPPASAAIDAVDSAEEAMRVKKKQGWSKKAQELATPGAWNGRGRSGTDVSPVGGSMSARSDTASVGGNTARSGATSARSGIAARQPTLADEWKLPDFSFTTMELERIQKMPFHHLQRAELKARKLLRRFHDEKDCHENPRTPNEEHTSRFEERCAKVRAKDPAFRTPEEKDWVEVDKKMFPEIWKRKSRQEDRVRRYNMTLASAPDPNTLLEVGHAIDEPDNGSGNNDDSDDDVDCKTLGSLHDGCSDRSIVHERCGDGGQAEWECPFDREEMILIWARDAAARGGPVPTRRRKKKAAARRAQGVDLMADRNDDAEKVRQMMPAFYGPFAAFSRNEALWVERRRHHQDLLTMSTSKRIAMYAADPDRAVDAAWVGQDGRAAPDAYIMTLLHELIAAKTIRSKYMDTSAIHHVPQRFDTEHYAKELEREIATELREQILERERVMEREHADAAHTAVTVVSDSSDDEAENWEVQEEKDFSLIEKVAMAATSIQRQRQHTKKSDDPRDRTQKRDGVREDHVNKLSSTAGAHAATHNSRKSGTDGSIGTRAAMEESSSTNLSSSGGVGGTSLTSESAAPTGSDSNGFESRSNEDGGLAPRQCHGTWHEPPVVQVFTAGEVADMIDDNPTWEGCRACLTLPCRWYACADFRLIEARKKQIKDEMFRLMGIWVEDVVCTVVPLSCVRGGSTTLLRTDAIRELRWEATELDRQLHLAQVDKELHNAFSCSQSAIEVRSLHAYPTLMWCKDAQVALSKERDHTVAGTVAVEVVDDLLECMLDGWVFGERQAEYAAGGTVPAVKASGPLRPGDQRRAVAYLEHRHRLRRIAHARGESVPEEIQGTHHTKALPIDASAQQRILDTRVEKKVCLNQVFDVLDADKRRLLRKKEDRQHLLGETETTMKFGLFSMVQGYLHAMTLVQREKEAWSGKGDIVGKDGNSHLRAPLTVERRRMIQEDVKARERAASRRNFFQRARKAEERSELRQAQSKRRLSQRKAMRVLEIRARDGAARNIQRVFRGFRGRIFAQRWALKYAEVEALKAVLHEAATNIQKAFRGHLGRVEASEVRMELAEYIADIRVKEAEHDLEEFWETHKLKKTKDAFEKKMTNTLGAPLVAMRRRKLE